MHTCTVFFPWTSKKCPWIFLQISRELFGCARELTKKKLVREPTKVPVNIKIDPENLKSACEHFITKWYIIAFTGTFLQFTGTLFHLCQKTAREIVQKRARERNHLPVNFRNKVPVNAKIWPWKYSKNWGSRALLKFTGEKLCDMYTLSVYPI